MRLGIQKGSLRFRSSSIVPFKAVSSRSEAALVGGLDHFRLRAARDWLGDQIAGMAIPRWRATRIVGANCA